MTSGTPIGPSVVDYQFGAGYCPSLNNGAISSIIVSNRWVLTGLGVWVSSAGISRISSMVWCDFTELRATPDYSRYLMYFELSDANTPMVTNFPGSKIPFTTRIGNNDQDVVQQFLLAPVGMAFQRATWTRGDRLNQITLGWSDPFVETSQVVIVGSGTLGCCAGGPCDTNLCELNCGTDETCATNDCVVSSTSSSFTTGWYLNDIVWAYRNQLGVTNGVLAVGRTHMIDLLPLQTLTVSTVTTSPCCDVGTNTFEYALCVQQQFDFKRCVGTATSTSTNTSTHTGTTTGINTGTTTSTGTTTGTTTGTSTTTGTNTGTGTGTNTGTSTGTGTGSGFPWTFVIIGIVGGLLLILIVVGLVISSNRRKAEQLALQQAAQTPAPYIQYQPEYAQTPTIQ